MFHTVPEHKLYLLLSTYQDVPLPLDYAHLYSWKQYIQSCILWNRIFLSHMCGRAVYHNIHKACPCLQGVSLPLLYYNVLCSYYFYLFVNGVTPRDFVYLFTIIRIFRKKNHAGVGPAWFRMVAPPRFAQGLPGLEPSLLLLQLQGIEIVIFNYTQY